jgi:hypothetical protein
MGCCSDDTGAFPVELTPPTRNNFYYGKMMDVLHFQMEQRYGIGKHALGNQLTLGEGVLCGLAVTVQDDQLCVGPGVAVDALGREIIVAAPVCIDPWAPPDPCEEKPPLDEGKPHVVYLCLAYRECQTEYGPVLVPDCNTKSQCAAGTTVESFTLRIIEGEPPELKSSLSAEACKQLFDAPAKDRRELLCKTMSDECPKAPEAPCVPLARVELEAGGTIGEVEICKVRPRVYSNAVLLDLILCLAEKLDECCGGESEPQPEPEAKPMKVQRVALVQTSAYASGVVAELDPTKNVQVSGVKVDAIDIFFTEPVDETTLTTPDTLGQGGATFTVRLAASAKELGNIVVPGKMLKKGSKHMRFTPVERFAVLPDAEYQLTLVGTPNPPHVDAIRDVSGKPLDGEPSALPSGDDQAGGNFKAKFEIKA